MHIQLYIGHREIAKILHSEPISNQRFADLAMIIRRGN
jgi:hypothetical protein